MTSIPSHGMFGASQTPSHLRPKPLSMEIHQFETLLLTANIPSSSPELFKLLSSIFPQLQDPSFMASEVFDLYPLHTKLFKISTLIRELNHTEISNGWRSLLASLSNHEFSLKSGRTIRPWIDRIVSYFNTGDRDRVLIRVLDPESISSPIVQQINQVAYASFEISYIDEQQLIDVLSSVNTVCVVAQDAKDHLLGYALGFAGPLTPDHQAFHLDTIARTPDAPGLGIGLQLMTKLEKVVKNRFAGTVQTINLNTHNKSAQRLYLKCGFKIIGSYYFKEVTMIKKLVPTAPENTPSEILWFKIKQMSQNQLISNQNQYFHNPSLIYRTYFMFKLFTTEWYMKVRKLVGWDRYFDFST